MIEQPGLRQTRAWVQQIMGMPISIHVRAAEPQRTDIEGAVRNCFAQLRRVDEVFSVWRPDSDVLRVRRGELSTDAARPWFAEVQRLCDQAEQVTGGLFTATLTGPDGSAGFDPTGLVKGWGVQAAAAHLELVPGIAFSVNASGDILCGVGEGMRGVESTWRIGIEDPRARGEIIDVIPVGVGAVATSGSAIRGAHIVDPRTARAVDRPGSVTVTGPDLLWCDVWATAAFVDPGAAQELMAAECPGYQLRTH